MKAKLFSLVMLVAMLAFGLAMTGCRTPGGALYSQNGVISDFPTIRVPAKDFVSLGIVLAEGVISSNQGEVYTYYALMKEAQKLGADAIVNVTISKKLRQGTTDETWYGAATAIRYTTGTISNTSVRQESEDVKITTETILMSSTASPESSGILTTISNAFSGSSDSNTSSTTVERKWYKPSTWFKKA